MNSDQPAICQPKPAKVPLVVSQRRRRRTPLARRRRLNGLIRELAADLGFSLESVTRAERATIHQCATLLLQVEVAGDQLVGGASIDPDTCIRLTSEARRLLSGLRERKSTEPAPPPFSPIRARWRPRKRRRWHPRLPTVMRHEPDRRQNDDGPRWVDIIEAVNDPWSDWLVNVKDTRVRCARHVPQQMPWGNVEYDVDALIRAADARRLAIVPTTEHFAVMLVDLPSASRS